MELLTYDQVLGLLDRTFNNSLDGCEHAVEAAIRGSHTFDDVKYALGRKDGVTEFAIALKFALTQEFGEETNGPVE